MKNSNVSFKIHNLTIPDHNHHTFFSLIVIENPGNDSLAYKTSFHDFRGEKDRDKTKDVSEERFKIGNYKTAKQRAED